MPDDQLRWGLQITGRDTDLQGMRRAFKSDFDPYLEDTDKGLVLWSKQLQCCTTSQEAWDDAVSLLRMVNSIMIQIYRSQPVKAEALIERKDDKGLKRHVFIEPVSLEARAIVGIAEVKVFDVDGNLVPPPLSEASTVQKWLKLATDDPNLFDLLNYSLQRNSWFEVYKAIEVLENLAGGERPLVNKWGKAVKILKWNANYFHRHAKGSQKPPAKEMSLHEANELLTKMIDYVFSTRLQASPSGVATPSAIDAATPEQLSTRRPLRS